MKILKILPRTENKIMLFFTKRLEKHKWSKNIIENLKTYILEGPSTVYNNIIYRYIYIKPILDNIGIRLSYKFTDILNIPYIVGIVLPRLIPCLILCYETLFLRHINYFYKSLFLLLIPLLFNILIYMIQYHSINSIEFYMNLFDITMTENKVDIFFLNQMIKNF